MTTTATQVTADAFAKVPNVLLRAVGAFDREEWTIRTRLWWPLLDDDDRQLVSGAPSPKDAARIFEQACERVPAYLWKAAYRKYCAGLLAAG
jgi:hypothetical protein